MKKPNSVRTLILAASLLLQLGALCIHSHGAAGDMDLSFDPGSGVNGTVNAVVVQPDGKVIIGGQFTTVKGAVRKGLARLNPDGGADATFDAGTNVSYSASSLALQPDGKLLAGHDGVLSRFHSNGDRDTNFLATLGQVGDSEGGFYSVVNSMAVQTDGRILIGGSFQTTSGTTHNTGIARLNSDGSVDAAFDAGTVEAWVYSLALQPDGKVLIGGTLNVGSPGYSAAARLNANGSVDNTFNPNTEVYGVVVALAAQPDGKVLIGGSFTSVSGTNRSSFARLNANGTLDENFHPTLGANGGWVKSVVVQPDGRIMLGGGFNFVNGTNRNGIARLNPDGSLEPGFDPGTGIGGTGIDEVTCLAMQTNGAVLIGGSFTRVNGTIRNRMARLNANGSLEGDFDPGAGVNDTVAALVVQPDGKVLAGGRFSTVKEFVSHGMARLEASGVGDGNFAATNLAAYGSVECLALQPDGKALVGGFFFMPNRRALARLNADGSLDGSFLADIGVIAGDFDYVTPVAIALQPDGKALIGGYSIHYECDFEGGCTVSHLPFLHRINTNGSRDTNFNPNIGFTDFLGARAVAVQPDGKVLVAGNFLTVEGIARKGLARLHADGSLDGSFDPGEGAFGISSIVLNADGEVLIGGGFALVNGVPRQGIARLQINGSVDNSFSPVSGAFEVATVVVQPNGKVLIGGNFTTINGANRNYIARINTDGSLDASFNSGAGPDRRVRSMALQPDGNVLIGGDFTAVNGVARPHLARLYGDSATPTLNIARSNAMMVVSWPASATGFVLQQNTNLDTTNWTTPSETVTDNGTTRSISVSPAPGSRWFRLLKP